MSHELERINRYQRQALEDVVTLGNAVRFGSSILEMHEARLQVDLSINNLTLELLDYRKRMTAK